MLRGNDVTNACRRASECWRVITWLPRLTAFALHAVTVTVAQPLATNPQVWHRPGQLPLASSIRIQAQGLRASGEPVTMDAVWGAMPDGDRVRLVHAVVYDRKIPPEMANTLFDGIKP